SDRRQFISFTEDCSRRNQMVFDFVFQCCIQHFFRYCHVAYVGNGAMMSCERCERKGVTCTHAMPVERAPIKNSVICKTTRDGPLKQWMRSLTIHEKEKLMGFPVDYT